MVNNKRKMKKNKNKNNEHMKGNKNKNKKPNKVGKHLKKKPKSKCPKKHVCYNCKDNRCQQNRAHYDSYDLPRDDRYLGRDAFPSNEYTYDRFIQDKFLQYSAGMDFSWPTSITQMPLSTNFMYNLPKEDYSHGVVYRDGYGYGYGGPSMKAIDLTDDGLMQNYLDDVLKDMDYKYCYDQDPALDDPYVPIKRNTPFMHEVYADEIEKKQLPNKSRMGYQVEDDEDIDEQDYVEAETELGDKYVKKMSLKEKEVKKIRNQEKHIIQIFTIILIFGILLVVFNN